MNFDFNLILFAEVSKVQDLRIWDRVRWKEKWKKRAGIVQKLVINEKCGLRASSSWSKCARNVARNSTICNPNNGLFHPWCTLMLWDRFSMSELDRQRDLLPSTCERDLENSYWTPSKIHLILPCNKLVTSFRVYVSKLIYLLPPNNKLAIKYKNVCKNN